MNRGEKGQWKYKSRFFGVTLGFVQDCSYNNLFQVMKYKSVVKLMNKVISVH